MLFGGASVLLPDGATAGNLESYSEIKKFSDLVFDHPAFFVENYPVSVINATKSSGLASKVALRLKKYGFNIPDESSVSNTKDDYPKSKILYRFDPVTKLGVSADASTLDILSGFVPARAEEE